MRFMHSEQWLFTHQGHQCDHRVRRLRKRLHFPD